MKRVIVSVTNDLSTDQRVQRICQSLHEWGYDVMLVGRKLPQSLKVNRDYPCKRMNLVFKTSFLFYAEYNLRLFFLLLFSKADILLSNDLDTLPANYLVAKLKHYKLVFDSHEYFSETPEVYKRTFVKSVWQFIEKICVKRCDVYYTVSQSVANIFKEKYNLIFGVIRNVPYRSFKPFEFKKTNQLIIYQGSVNVGRGLDLIIKALALNSNFKLIIAGEGPELKRLKSLVISLKLQSQVNFLGKLLPEKLKDITTSASLGISIEEPIGRSYISSLPNKIFDYIQAGIPILVSDLPEMRAIVNQYQVGMVLEDRSPENLIKLLKAMTEFENLRKTWNLNLEKASELLCWEKESVKLKSLFDSL